MGQLKAGARLRSSVCSTEVMVIAAPGVLAVLTGAEVRADGLGTLPSVKDPRVEMKRRDGSPAYYPPQPILATGRVRHVGEPVAMSKKGNPSAGLG